ncbi:MAG: GntR family transcriptional regulator [Polyangiales bacterium]
MLIVLDSKNSEPLYKQIADQLRNGIRDGRAVDGEKLPAAKALAASLEVNLHTVLRAYSILRDEGLIQMRRGRGTTVIAPQKAPTALSVLAQRLVDEASQQGLSAEELVNLIAELTRDGGKVPQS